MGFLDYFLVPPEDLLWPGDLVIHRQGIGVVVAYPDGVWSGKSNMLWLWWEREDRVESATRQMWGMRRAVDPRETVWRSHAENG